MRLERTLKNLSCLLLQLITLALLLSVAQQEATLLQNPA